MRSCPAGQCNRVTEPAVDHPDRPAFASFLRSFFGHSAVRYLIVGGLSFIIDFGLIFVLHVLASWPLWLATATAFLASFVFNYTLQRAFSFSSRSPHGRALVKYAILVAANTIITVVIVDLLNATAVGWEWGKVISTVVTTLSNYVIYRKWIFPVVAQTEET
jgi:putative flippase GtrA